MTDDERAFRRKICENPADDTPRLVFADWLEERGRGWPARFIRIQVGRQYVPFCQEIIDEFGAIIRDLERAAVRHGAIYPGQRRDVSVTDDVATVFAALVRVEYRRGFLNAIHCPLAAWLEHGPRLVAEQPVEAVTVTDGFETVDDVNNRIEMRVYYRPTLGPLWEFLSQRVSPAPATTADRVAESRSTIPGIDPRGLLARQVDAAALDWARREAGLPPLPATQ